MKKFISLVAIVTLLCFTGIGFANDTNTNVGAGIIGIDNNANAQGQGQSVDMGENYSRAIGAPIPGSVGYGPLINYFGKALPSSGFQPVEQLIMYGCWFTDGALKNMLKKVEDAEAEFKVTNIGLEPAPAADENGKTKWIKVVVSRDKYTDAEFVGYVTARSENAKTTMTEVLAKSALEAMNNGCNVLHLIAQGAVRDAFATGWGIGFASTQAQVYSNDNKSNVSAGGFGYSSGQAGMRDKPWLQGFGLIDRNLDYPELRLAKAEPKPVILNNVKEEQIEATTDDNGNVVKPISEAAPVDQKIAVDNATLKTQ